MPAMSKIEVRGLLAGHQLLAGAGEERDLVVGAATTVIFIRLARLLIPGRADRATLPSCSRRRRLSTCC